MNMKAGNPVHEFIRVRDGVRQPQIRLRSSITIDGEIYHNDTRLWPETIEGLELFLDIAERALGRAVGDKIVRGIDL